MALCRPASNDLDFVRPSSSWEWLRYLSLGSGCTVGYLWLWWYVDAMNPGKYFVVIMVDYFNLFRWKHLFYHIHHPWGRVMLHLFDSACASLYKWGPPISQRCGSGWISRWCLRPLVGTTSPDIFIDSTIGKNELNITNLFPIVLRNTHPLLCGLQMIWDRTLCTPWQNN